jgi:hypothetical protein
MKLIKIFLILVVALIPPGSFAKELKLPTLHGDGNIILNFDEKNISEKMLRVLVGEIHPQSFNLNYVVTYQLELCIKGDKDYFQCGSRNIHDNNFFKNAEVNLRKSRADLDHLETLQYISELEPIVAYFRKCLEFGMWKNESLLQFYKTWDIQHLKTRFNGIDPSIVAREAIDNIETARSKESKYKLARKEWGNAVNRYFRIRIGELPREAWDVFLKKYNIEEKIIYKDNY